MPIQCLKFRIGEIIWDLVFPYPQKLIFSLKLSVALKGQVILGVFEEVDLIIWGSEKIT